MLSSVLLVGVGGWLSSVLLLGGQGLQGSVLLLLECLLPGGLQAAVKNRQDGMQPQL